VVEFNIIATFDAKLKFPLDADPVPQIKTWASSSEVKDKAPLLEARRTIEQVSLVIRRGFEEQHCGHGGGVS
jgi:hypothetical protein